MKYSLILFFLISGSFVAYPHSFSNKVTLSPVEALKKNVLNASLRFDERWDFLNKVVEIEGVKSKEFLEFCLKRKEWFLRSGALKNYAEYFPEESIKQASILFKEDSALVVRTDALEVIRRYGSKSHNQLLWRELYSKKNYRGKQSLWIRPQIAETIIKLSNNKLTPDEYKSLMNDSDQKIVALAKAFR